MAAIDCQTTWTPTHSPISKTAVRLVPQGYGSEGTQQQQQIHSAGDEENKEVAKTPESTETSKHLGFLGARMLMEVTRMYELYANKLLDEEDMIYFQTPLEERDSAELRGWCMWEVPELRGKYPKPETLPLKNGDPPKTTARHQKNKKITPSGPPVKTPEPPTNVVPTPSESPDTNNPLQHIVKNLKEVFHSIYDEHDNENEKPTALMVIKTIREVSTFYATYADKVGPQDKWLFQIPLQERIKRSNSLMRIWLNSW